MLLLVPPLVLRRDLLPLLFVFKLGYAIVFPPLVFLFAEKLSVTFQPGFVQRTVLNSLVNRTARFRLVAAIPETTRCGKLLDVVKAFPDVFKRVRQLKFAQTGCIHQEAASREQDKFTLRGRVSASGIGVPDIERTLTGTTDQGIDDS